MPSPCPRCSSSMRLEMEGLHRDIEVLSCPDRECGALWLSSEGLDRLDDNIFVRASRLRWTERPDRAGLSCPACASAYRSGASLEALELGAAPSVRVHRCPRCSGFLLDSATRERIRVYVLPLR